MFSKKNQLGLVALNARFIACPNKECLGLSVAFLLFEWQQNGNYGRYGKLVRNLNLIPQLESKQFPNYIPGPIIQDYNEACAISDLSPKASATLARRCIQGIIRDYFNVTKSRLVDEIDAIKEEIDPLTWAPLDSLRTIRT